jgi:hypothetical protein
MGIRPPVSEVNTTEVMPDSISDSSTGVCPCIADSTAVLIMAPTAAAAGAGNPALASAIDAAEPAAPDANHSSAAARLSAEGPRQHRPDILVPCGGAGVSGFEGQLGGATPDDDHRGRVGVFPRFDAEAPEAVRAGGVDVASTTIRLGRASIDRPLKAAVPGDRRRHEPQHVSLQPAASKRRDSRHEDLIGIDPDAQTGISPYHQTAPGRLAARGRCV